MTGRIEVGRSGYRNAKEVKPTRKDCVLVDCRTIVDPNFEKLRLLSIEEVERTLRGKHGAAFERLVDRVVRGVLDDNVVHVRCTMGENRSQSVAWAAYKRLRSEHPNLRFVGPVCLQPIQSRFPLSSAQLVRRMARPACASWRMKPIKSAADR